MLRESWKGEGREIGAVGVKGMANVAHANVPRNSQRREGQNNKNWEVLWSARVKSCVNISEALQQWRDLQELKGLKADALFLLDRWLTLVLLFHRTNRSVMFYNGLRQSFWRSPEGRDVGYSMAVSSSINNPSPGSIFNDWAFIFDTQPKLFALETFSELCFHCFAMPTMNGRNERCAALTMT